MSLARCVADLSLDIACHGHVGVDLFWCEECTSHGCGHVLDAALDGCRVSTLPPRGAPRLRLAAWTPGTCQSARVMWRDDTWQRPIPVFISELRCRLSLASEYFRLVELGCN